MDSNLPSGRPLANERGPSRPISSQRRAPTATPTPCGRGMNFNHHHAQRPPTQRPFPWEQAKSSENALRHGDSRRFQRAPERAPAPRLSFQTRARQDIAKRTHLKIIVKHLPPDAKTLDIYTELIEYGSVDRIEILEPRRTDSTNAIVVFSPPPSLGPWLQKGMTLSDHLGRDYKVDVEVAQHQRDFRFQSPVDKNRNFPEIIKMPLSQLEVGVMKETDTMLVLHTPSFVEGAPLEIILNLHRKAVDLVFLMAMKPTNGELRIPTLPPRLFKVRINLPQVASIFEMDHTFSQRKEWVLSTTHPPVVFRRTENIEATHDPKSNLWSEMQSWLRQTEIDAHPQSSRTLPIELPRKESCIIDIGRCLTYKLTFDEMTVKSDSFKTMCLALRDHSVPIRTDRMIHTEYHAAESLWSWLDNPVGTAAIQHAEASSSLTMLDELARETVQLPFVLRYQLETCISQGILHECNITREFLEKLTTSPLSNVLRLLEKAVQGGQRFYNPEELFQRLSRHIITVSKPIPWYCATVRLATITPTSIYFMTPMVETSNRVVRKYSQYEDRFLRVKFTDEKYKGRIQSFGDNTMDEVFSRIKCALKNGINVAGRHYDFLAFGNSQFREHGAWFFASTGDLTADKMRRELGEFNHIKVVAKYASRIGQCFSTTKWTGYSVRVEEIPDITRGEKDYCFTDGVGRISPFLVRLIVDQLKLPVAEDKWPSAFQFRYEGRKGILVTDPALKDKVIQTRPSQNKFPGAAHQGLEIVRVSQFSACYLNIQLILVLSSLGVSDAVFVEKMDRQLSDLAEAMYSERKAMKLLSKYIDFNRMTLQLVCIILDGFMRVEEPFFISCLRLWRSWSLKYLKEKARIYIDEGAFVLGCVDETGTLRGHLDTDEPDDHEINRLPQIFLQIDRKGDGKTQIIEGVCMLMRNPSLHPGDVRLVQAIDVPALHHIRDCVVLPSTGDRDLANMCSGGDLDGDDYLVIWDQTLMPKEWNHPPMDFTPLKAVTVPGDVTVDDMTSFFVKYIKYDQLGPIAVAHKYWADLLDDGVKSERCIRLANLHSAAVDYAKTGREAVMEKDLKVPRRPHWSEPKNKSKMYHSKKIIGQLYDAVQRQPFHAAWNKPFDSRILEAYDLDDEMLNSAREVKELYDESMRQVMARYAIGNEFEVWTTFVMEHSDDVGDYKFAETIGEAAGALKDSYRKLCLEEAGTNEKERDWSKLGPFVAAMYFVTAAELRDANEECERKEKIGGEWVNVKVARFENMPFMSFPWLFPAELGRIANSGLKVATPRRLEESRTPAKSDAGKDALLNGADTTPLSEEDSITDQLAGFHILDDADLYAEANTSPTREEPSSASESYTNILHPDTPELTSNSNSHADTPPLPPTREPSPLPEDFWDRFEGTTAESLNDRPAEEKAEEVLIEL